MAFKRVCELFIGSFKDGNNTSKGYLISDLHFDFEVFKSNHYYKNFARFDIYNPNDNTISEIIDVGGAVVFRAGHEDEQVGNIFVGQIASAYCERNLTNDNVLHLFCNAQRGAEYQLEKVFISIVHKVGTSYFEILKSIADYCGIPISGASSLKEIYLDASDGDYIDSGDVVSVMTNFVSRKLRAINGEVILSNNELIYIDNENKTEFDTVHLTYNNGLISASKARDESYQSTEAAFSENMEYYLSGKGKLNKIEKEIKKNEVTFETILMPSLNVHTPVFINNSKEGKNTNFINGLFWIKEITFAGSNYSDEFICKCRAVE